MNKSLVDIKQSLLVGLEDTMENLLENYNKNVEELNNIKRSE